MKVNLGGKKLEGWVNADEKEPCDVLVKSFSPLPFETGSVDLFYSSVTIEHLSLSNALTFLTECYRILKPGGKLRIATIDLDGMVNAYKGNWKNQKWLKENPAINSRGKMLNFIMRSNGHRYVFNFEDLSALMVAVGFVDIEKKDFGKSGEKDFQKIDSRSDAKLIVEAVKL